VGPDLASQKLCALYLAQQLQMVPLSFCNKIFLLMGHSAFHEILNQNVVIAQSVTCAILLSCKDMLFI